MHAQSQNLLSLLGYVLLKSARPDKAAAVLAALDRIAPGERKTLRALALALVRAGKAKQALDTLDRLAIAGGVDAAFHLLRAQALITVGRHDEATVAMDNFLQLRGMSNAAGVPTINGV